MILTINLDPVESIPKLYDAIDSITRMVMDAKDNVDNPEIKAARQAIVDNAMKLLGAPAKPKPEAETPVEGDTKAESKPVAEDPKKLTPREFALAALDFAKPLMKLDPKRTVDALHQLYTLEEGESDNIMKALDALIQTLMQPDVLGFTKSLGMLNATDFGF